MKRSVLMLLVGGMMALTVGGQAQDDSMNQNGAMSRPRPREGGNRGNSGPGQGSTMGSEMSFDMGSGLGSGMNRRPDEGGSGSGTDGRGGPGGGQRQRRGPPPLEKALDADSDGFITSAEMAGSAAALKTLDTNGDGQLTSDEYRPSRQGGPGLSDNQGMSGNAGGQRQQQRQGPIVPLEVVLDADGDQTISAQEIANSATTIKTLDKDGDGRVARSESQPPRPEDRQNQGERQDGKQGNNQGLQQGQRGNDRSGGNNSGSGSGGNRNQKGGGENAGGFTMQQTLSDEAQWTTIAFSGIGFLTGSQGADSWFPPGKVSDFWGFQYLRDNDPSRMGHNTDFLTRAANNMLAILTDEQKSQLSALAEQQVEAINQYAYKRFVLIKAFRRLLEGATPSGAPYLSQSAVRAFSADLYKLDGEITYQRAQVMGGILNGLSAQQRASLNALVGKGMTSWPDLPDQVDKRAFAHDVHVAIMTYAGDLFSWYMGSLDADVYFCPERQGTYFGGFFIKGGPAHRQRNYTINENLTADLGRNFVAALPPAQGSQITGLVNVQRPFLLEIVRIRGEVAKLLRGFIKGQAVDKAAVLQLMERYGDQDGAIIYHLATTFVNVGHALTDAQMESFMKMRTQLNLPEPQGAFLYSSPIDMPAIPNTDFLFTAQKQ